MNKLERAFGRPIEQVEIPLKNGGIVIFQRYFTMDGNAHQFDEIKSDGTAGSSGYGLGALGFESYKVKILERLGGAA